MIADLQDAQVKLGNLIVAHAAQTGEMVRFVTTDPEGSWTLIVHPDGRMVNEADITSTLPEPELQAPEER